MATMTRETIDKIVNDHFMYKATADLEGVLSTYSDEPEHQVVAARTVRTRQGGHSRFL